MVTSQKPFRIRCWFNLNISRIFLRTWLRVTALPRRRVATIPILEGAASSRANVASTRCFPIQDLPDVLTELNSEARFNRDDRGNLNRIRPGRTITSKPEYDVRMVILRLRESGVSDLADAAGSKSLFRPLFSSELGSQTGASGCVSKVDKFFSCE
jgi:hypothetical protein